MRRVHRIAYQILESRDARQLRQLTLKIADDLLYGVGIWQKSLDDVGLGRDGCQQFLLVWLKAAEKLRHVIDVFKDVASPCSSVFWDRHTTLLETSNRAIETLGRFAFCRFIHELGFKGFAYVMCFHCIIVDNLVRA
jgi:hypothetical protein